MWWVLFIASKHKTLAQTYKPKVKKLFHKSWHIKEYLGV
jgi:hypothetical protein